MAENLRQFRRQLPRTVNPQPMLTMLECRISIPLQQLNTRKEQRHRQEHLMIRHPILQHHLNRLIILPQRKRNTRPPTRPHHLSATTIVKGPIKRADSQYRMSRSRLPPQNLRNMNRPEISIEGPRQRWRNHIVII